MFYQQTNGHDFQIKYLLRYQVSRIYYIQNFKTTGGKPSFLILAMQKLNLKQVNAVKKQKMIINKQDSDNLHRKDHKYFFDIKIASLKL